MKWKRIGYDDVWTDEVGNVIGRLAGGDGPTIMLNGHMDVVDVGDHATRGRIRHTAERSSMANCGGAAVST